MTGRVLINWKSNCLKTRVLKHLVNAAVFNPHGFYGMSDKHLARSLGVGRGKSAENDDLRMLRRILSQLKKDGLTYPIKRSRNLKKWWPSSRAVLNFSVWEEFRSHMHLSVGYSGVTIPGNSRVTVTRNEELGHLGT